MKTTETKENWEVQKRKLKQKFATLTDDDLRIVDGKKNDMLAKIQVKLGKTKEEFNKILSNL